MDSKEVKKQLDEATEIIEEQQWPEEVKARLLGLILQFTLLTTGHALAGLAHRLVKAQDFVSSELLDTMDELTQMASDMENEAKKDPTGGVLH